MTIFILSVAVALVVSFLCSLAEAVLLSLTTTRLETLKEQGKSHAAVWLNMRRNIERPIAAILILNTVAHTGGATIAGSAFDDIYGDKWIWLFSLIFTVLVLFGTEIAPKVIGVAYSQRFAPIMAGPLTFIIRLLTPLLWITEAFSRFLKPSRTATSDEESTEASDLITLARLARGKSLIESQQEQIIVKAAKMRDLKVADAMLPAADLVCFDIRKSTSENLETARQTLHTRYPVSETGTPQGIVGYVNLKEIFAVPPAERAPTLEPYLRGVVFIEAESTLNQALQVLIQRRQHIAVVRDRQKQVCGLLTMEDILQEIVGDYGDELDTLPRDLIRLGEGRWQVGAGVTIRSIKETTGLHPGNFREDQYLGEWITAVLPHPIRQGSSLSTPPWKITVQLIRRGLPHQILIEKISA